MRRVAAKDALLAVAVVTMAGSFAASGATEAVGVPRAVLMSFTFGPGADQIDTTCVDPGDPFRTVVQSFRVEQDGAVWILSGRAPEQSLRSFRSMAGLARACERIILPGDRGVFRDFIFLPGAIVLSRAIGDAENLAAFCRFEPGKGIVDEVLLPHEAGFNRYHGQKIANLGRLRMVADTLYDCFERNGACVRIGTDRLFRELGEREVIIGSPTMTGGPIWCDRKRVFHGITPIVDLSDGLPAEIEDVFEDGSFVIRRIADGSADARPSDVERYEMYSEDGRLLRSIAIPRPDPPVVT